jgi:hypothetical protein
MPPDFLQNLQGILGNFFSRRLRDESQAASPATEVAPLAAAPMAQGISPSEFALMERELLAPPPMPQDVTSVALAPLFSEPEQHSIVGTDPSLYEMLPLQIRKALEIREGTILGTAKDALDFLGELNPFEFIGGPLGAAMGPLRAAGAAKPEIQAVARGMRGIDIIDPKLVQRANAGEVGIVTVPANSGRIQGARNVAMPDLTPIDARIGQIVLESPVGPANTPQLQRAVHSGYTTDAYHGTAAHSVFEGIPRPGRTRGTDRGGIFIGWSHFGTPEAAWQRIGGGSSAGMPSWQHVQYARVMPAKLRGPFLQTTDDGANVGSAILGQVKASNVLDRHDLMILENILYTGGTENFKQVLGPMLNNKGIRGFRYVNAHEDIGSISYVMFNPRHVRSMWAEFDLEKLMEAGLMLGAGGAIMGGQQLMESQPQPTGAMQ